MGESGYDGLLRILTLLAGTLLAVNTVGGTRYFDSGDPARGVIFATISAMTVLGWVGPYLGPLKNVATNSVRALTLVILAFWLYAYVAERYVSALPRLLR